MKTLFLKHAISFVIPLLISIGSNAADIVTVFDPVKDGIPEAIATDYRGNLYTSMGTSVRKFKPSGKLLQVFNLPVSGGLGNGDLVINWNGDVFVNSNGDDASEKGVWRIKRTGEITKFADIDPSTSGFLNGIIIDCYDNLYVSDSQANKIYKITPQGEVLDWLVDSNLAGDGSVLGFPVGVNNLVFDRSQRFIYASNLDKGSVLKIKVKRDGSAGKIKEFVKDPLLKGIDGITFDRRGGLYAAVNLPNRIVKITKKGQVKVIEDPQLLPETLLEFPSDVVFGKGKNSFTLYISNFSAFTNSFPAILKIENINKLKFKH